MSVRTSLHMRREEKPTRCHCILYCTYMLIMFRALLCPSSGALDYMCIIAAYGVQCCKGEKIGLVLSSIKIGLVLSSIKIRLVLTH